MFLLAESQGNPSESWELKEGRRGRGGWNGVRELGQHFSESPLPPSCMTFCC